MTLIRPDIENTAPPNGRGAIFPWDTEDRPSLPPKALRVLWLAAAGCLILALSTPIIPKLVHHELPVQAPPITSQLEDVSFPTPQQALLGPVVATVFQPTSSGRPEPALYGSVRSYPGGSPKFHEGIDIAPMQRDSRKRAQDAVFAIADGKIVYINRSAGKSSYGIYLVVEHLDPVGPVYTLYAHLASVHDALEEDAYVARGRELGIMGHTSTLGVPVSRSHLHFEIGLMTNAAFHRFTKTPHGIFDGRNLSGLNPVEFFRFKEQTFGADFGDFLQQVPTAFTIVIGAKVLPDFFRRYRGLWTGPDYAGGAITLDVSEGGVPLRGRNASREEVKKLGKARCTVVSADEAVLGRNGKRLVAKSGTSWKPGKNIDYWLRLLTYAPARVTG